MEHSFVFRLQLSERIMAVRTHSYCSNREGFNILHSPGACYNQRPLNGVIMVTMRVGCGACQGVKSMKRE